MLKVLSVTDKVIFIDGEPNVFIGFTIYTIFRNYSLVIYYLIEVLNKIFIRRKEEIYHV